MQPIELTLPWSSSGGSGVDDALKDHDNSSWLSQVESGRRADWTRRLQWVRLVDRLAEQRLLHGDSETLANHFLIPRHPAEFGVSWCEAWQRYVVAAHRYQEPKTIVPDLEAHREMLLELGGNVFCLLPEVDWSLRRSIAHFGALDRYFDNLRDLTEDSQQGRCHFPLDVLARFGLSPQDFVTGTSRSKPGYAALMTFWLDEYLPTLRLEAAEFSNLKGLPRALRLMRESCLQRHARIERAFRDAGFDSLKAHASYWSEVARERLPGGCSRAGIIRNGADAYEMTSSAVGSSPC